MITVLKKVNMLCMKKSVEEKNKQYWLLELYPILCNISSFSKFRKVQTSFSVENCLLVLTTLSVGRHLVVYYFWFLLTQGPFKICSRNTWSDYNLHLQSLFWKTITSNNLTKNQVLCYRSLSNLPCTKGFDTVILYFTQLIELEKSSIKKIPLRK